MNQELQNKLFEKYPSIFRDANASPKASCMGFGIECRNGWYNIIDAACAALSYGYCSSKNPDEFGEADDNFRFDTADSLIVVADQLKEKFGTIRFYIHYENSEEFERLSKLYPKTAQAIANEIRHYHDGIIHMAESMSALTCEETGKPGVLCVRGGWYKTLCAEKAKEFGFTVCNEDTTK